MESGLKKGPWMPEEDEKLRAYIEQHGIGSWRPLPAKAGLKRCGKSCRLRWTTYLRPEIKRGRFSLVEEQIISRLHALLGNRWSAIATHLPKRTDSDIKNYWYTHLANKGIDLVTHKPCFNATPCRIGSGAATTSVQQHTRQPSAHLSSHRTMQWESVRLQAEARERVHHASQLRVLAASASASVLSPPHHMPPRPAEGDGPPALASVREAHGAAAPAMQLQPITPAYEEEVRRKDDQHQQQRWGDNIIDAVDADVTAAAFAGMLLDESLHQEQAEVEKKCWVFIMNLVNSSSSSASSSLQTSVVMPPPKA